MACAYVGSTFMPPLFGAIAERLGIALYPLYLALLVAGMTALSETVNHRRRTAH